MNDMVRLFNDPNARHAILVHVPIALSVLGVIPAIALALTKFRNVTLKWTCVAWFVVASGGAFFAENAGHEAEEQAEKVVGGLSESQEQALHEHEELGEDGWMWPGLTALVFAGSFIPKKRVAPIAGTLGLLAGAGVLYWAAITGHAGGKLVYEMGVGGPSPALTGALATESPGAEPSHEAQESKDEH